MKKFLRVIRKPMGFVLKSSVFSSVFIAFIALLVHALQFIVGNGTLLGGIEGTMKTFAFAYLLQVLIASPWVGLYGTVRVLFEALFPKKEEELKETSKQTNKTYAMTRIEQRKVAIQEKIYALLEENNGHFDVEEVHTLERIHENLLEETEKLYEALEKDAKMRYEQEILKRFDELEGKVNVFKEKLERQKQHELDKKLRVIDQVTNKTRNE